MSCKDYQEFNQKEVYLSKEHLIKEGWKYDEIDNLLELITEYSYTLRINGAFLTVEGGTWYYGGYLPNLEQWEVLKGLLNICG